MTDVPLNKYQLVAAWCDYIGAEEGKIDKRSLRAWATFRDYHLERPTIWDYFEKFTLEVIASGKKQYGAHGIFQRIRWYTDIERRGTSFKVDNTAFPFYSRVFCRMYEAHAEFFRHQDKPLLGMSRSDAVELQYAQHKE